MATPRERRWKTVMCGCELAEIPNATRPALPQCDNHEGDPSMSMLSSAVQRSTLGLHTLEQYELLIGTATLERIEAMSREQAAVAKTEMEHSLMEYWLAEAEEWKRLRQSIHSKDEFRIAQVT
jgi:hypothetical protein